MERAVLPSEGPVGGPSYARYQQKMNKIGELRSQREQAELRLKGWAQLITLTALTNPDSEESTLLHAMRAEQRKTEKEVEELVIIPMHIQWNTIYIYNVCTCFTLGSRN